MKKVILLTMTCLLVLSGTAMAQKIQPLNVFPWTLSTENIPVYPENIEQLCTTDIIDSQCEVNLDGGTLVTKEIPYSGSKEYSGVTYYDGELPVVASGTVPFDTYDKTGTQSFTIAVTAPLCGPGEDKACCTAKGNPDDGTITLVCQKISPTQIIDNQTFTYDLCEEKTVDVPWSFNGSGHYAGNVPYSGTVEYSGTTSCEYKEYAATDVLYNEGSVVIDCPDGGDFQTQEVTFRELVTNAHVGDHIEIEATGWTAVEKMISHRIIVKYAEPGKSIFSLVTRSDRTQLVASGIFKVNLEGGLTFDKSGTYQIIFKVWKPNGLLAGKAVTRTVIVAE